MLKTRIALIVDGRHNEVSEVPTLLRALRLHHPDDLELEEYVVPPAAPSSTMRKGLWGLRARLIEDEATAVHVLSPGVAAVVARWVSVGLQIPLVASYHGAADPRIGAARGSLNSVARRHYDRWLYKGSARIVVSSALLLEDLVRERWTSPDRMVIAKAGVHPGLFSANKRSAALREAWQVSDRRPAILCRGALATRELEMVARFRRILEDHRRPHRFIICGPLWQRDAWQDAVPDGTFIDDRADPDLASIFASSDLLLAAREGTYPDPGTTLLMAQASGVPVLVPNTVSCAENMIDGVTGYLCRAGSEQDFAWRAAELLANGPRRAAMAASAITYARTRPWATALEPLFQTYRDVARQADSALALKAIGVRTA